MPKGSKNRFRLGIRRGHCVQMDAARAEAFAEDEQVTKSDIQQAIEREARRAALGALAELDLTGGSQILVSGMSGVARVLDMSRSKVQRLRASAASNGIPFPEAALYAGLGSTKSYWLRDIEGWVEDVSASGMDW